MSGPRPKLPIKNLGLLAALVSARLPPGASIIPMAPKGEKVRNASSARGDEKRRLRAEMRKAYRANPMNDGRISSSRAHLLYLLHTKREKREKMARILLDGMGHVAVGYLARGGQ